MYSQYGEDDIVAGIVGDHVGRLLEIGAWNPVDKSNSRLLIEKGWQAMLVEFSPRPVRDLVLAYGTCERVQVVQCAIGPADSGLRKFAVTDDAVSTSDAGHFETWKEHGGAYYGSLWVPQVPIADFLRQFGGGFDFVSIDTEGSSIEIALALLGPCEQRPKVLCVEHGNRVIELMQVAQQFGYSSRWVNGTNIIIAL